MKVATRRTSTTSRPARKEKAKTSRTRTGQDRSSPALPVEERNTTKEKRKRGEEKRKGQRGKEETRHKDDWVKEGKGKKVERIEND